MSLIKPLRLFVLWLTMLSALLLPVVGHTQQVPTSVYNRYVVLATKFAKLTEQTKQTAGGKLLFSAIDEFYQQQHGTTLARQLLASNLQLQVLLMQHNHQQGYQVVNELLSLPLTPEQQLTFQQLAAQLAAQSTAAEKINQPAIIASWARVSQHLNAWFVLVDALDERQRLRYRISLEQQAANAALLAQAYYLQEQLESALAPAIRAYKLIPVNEPYLQLVLALLQRLERHQQLNHYLQLAVVDFPQQPDYWLRLAYSYMALGQQERALSTLAITRNQGLLNGQGYQLLAALYLQQQQPRLAAVVYQEGAEKQLLIQDERYFSGLSHAWLMARERGKALAVLAQATEAGITLAGQDQLRAQLLYVQARWAEAELAYGVLLQALPTDINDEEALLQRDKWRYFLALSQIEQDKTAQAKAQLLQLQSPQYQRYSKAWLARL